MQLKIDLHDFLIRISAYMKSSFDGKRNRLIFKKAMPKTLRVGIIKKNKIMDTMIKKKNAVTDTSESASEKSFKKHLIKEVLKQNGEFEMVAEKSLLSISDEADSEKRQMFKAKSLPTGGQVILPVSSVKKLIEIQVLGVPFALGTSYVRELASELPSSVSSLCKTVTKSNFGDGEINMAAVQGQLFSQVYSNNPAGAGADKFANATCGSLSKKVQIAGYPFDVLVKSITRVFMPSNREAVYFADTGNLELAKVGVEGKTLNTLSYQKSGGGWVSRTSNRTFLNVIKTTTETVNDFYQHEYVQENSITLPAGTTEFNYNVLAQIWAFTSKDFSSNAGLDTGNYGLALVDLRSRLNSNADPIAIRPFTNEFKDAAGGIVVHVTLEFYK